MFHLFPRRTIIKTFAYLHAAIFVLLIITQFTPSGTSYSIIIRIASILITVLDIVVYLISTIFWRWIWKRIPILPEQIFPDLNGIWEGKIMFVENGEEKALAASVRIRQNWWRITVDLYSETSKSHTLVAYPVQEAGNPKLYYIYHNIPQNPSYSEYKGVSILEPKNRTELMELTGSYFTIRKTVGRIELKQKSPNSNQPYELF